MANQNRLLPGILTNDIEFFLSDNNIKALTSGKTIDFSEVPFKYIEALREEIDKDKKLKLHLFDLFPNNEYKRLEQFVKCRFGGLDYQADITADGLQEGEWWPCPLRGKCASEGVLCKSVVVNDEKLEAQDITLIQLLTTNDTNETIAMEMGLALGSFHLYKKKLYKKLGNIQTKQELTILAQRLNFI